MAQENQSKPGTADPGTAAQAPTEPLKRVLAAVSQTAHATVALAGDFASRAQKEWTASADSYLKLWVEMGHAWVDATTGAAQLEVELGQKIVDSLRGFPAGNA